jgi:uncharacterized protein YggU (UPF0235/DUF167 family)
VDGKANDRLIRFLAGRLEVPPSHIQIIRGHTVRDNNFS